MICLTGRESSVARLAERLEHGFSRLSGCLQEVRLDALDAHDEDLFDLLSRYADRLVVCCRSPHQGGFRALPEDDRCRLLLRAGERGAAWLDIDFPVDAEFVPVLRRRTESRLILAVHDFTGFPEDMGNILKGMRDRRPDALKVAVTVPDAADLLRLRAWSEISPLPGLWIGMGYAGLLSRVRYPFFRSLWTYACADEVDRTAPGQLTLDRALAMGLPGSAEMPFLALVGGPQVRFSPGPKVYNHIFRKAGCPYAYVPVMTGKPLETFSLLRDMGAFGASVTMPHKVAALACAEPDPDARRTGAANTIRFGAAGMSCTNTDIGGVREPLRRALAGAAEDGPLQAPNRTALILGAGGAARAAASACEDLGLEVVFSARDREKAVLELPPRSRLVPWKERSDVEAAFLLNATAAAGAECPWPEDQPLGKTLVFDLALGPEPSRLLWLAAAEGAVGIPALEMWLHQGAAQLRYLTGMDIDTEALREYLQ